MSNAFSSDRRKGPSGDQDRLRALLRLKRLERPPDAFWSGFERDLQRELFRSVRRNRPSVTAWVLAPVFVLAGALVMTILWMNPDSSAHRSAGVADFSPVPAPEAAPSWADEEWSGTRFVSNIWTPREEERLYAVSNALGNAGPVQEAAAETVFYVSDRWSREEQRRGTLTLNP